MHRLSIIVAAAAANGIGINGRLPWRLPKEMAYFARITSQAPAGQTNAVIMGRKTWESIPPKFRPLPNRLNIILSRDEGYTIEAPDAEVHPTLQAGIDALNGHSIHRIFIIGGSSLYKEGLETSSPSFTVDRVLMTRITSPSFDCDTFMSILSEQEWTQCTHSELKDWAAFDVPENTQEEKGVQYEFQMWIKTL